MQEKIYFQKKKELLLQFRAVSESLRDVLDQEARLEALLDRREAILAELMKLSEAFPRRGSGAAGWSLPPAVPSGQAGSPDREEAGSASSAAETAEKGGVIPLGGDPETPAERRKNSPAALIAEAERDEIIALSEETDRLIRSILTFDRETGRLIRDHQDRLLTEMKTNINEQRIAQIRFSSMETAASGRRMDYKK